MAKSLKIQIEMAGAEEIKRQLEGVGEAGEEAFNKILSAAQQAGGFKELDPAFLKQSFDELGATAPAAIGKITQAVKSASRMETLVNALTGVENGLAGIQRAALAVDSVLGTALVRSLTIIGRLLPAAFAAATIGAIGQTVSELKKLDAAAVAAGISIGEMAKAQEIFKQIGLSSKEAADAVARFTNNLEKVKAAVKTLDEFGESTEAGVKALRTLREAALGSGEAADIAVKKLREMGQIPLSGPAADIDRIKESTLSASQQLIAIIGILEQMGNTAERNRLAEKFLGPEFAQALRAGGVELEQLKQKLLGLSAPSQQAANDAIKVGLEWQKLKNLFSSGFTVSPEGLQAVNTLLNLIATTLTTIGSKLMQFNFIAGALNFGNTLRELEFIGKLLTQIGNIGVSIWDGIATAAVTAWKTVIGWIDKAIQALRAFFGLGGGRVAEPSQASGFARGGPIGGRGSGTSDSNLAWLSRGEHVMPANAVRQPGVLALLEALRRSGGNLRSVLDRMGHFALGGLVGAPAFAAGGVNGMNHVTIAFPGLPPIGGLRASSAVVDELRRAAALAQVRSGGRKPSRYS